MSELVGLWAELALPAQNVSSWLGSRADTAAWNDWLDPLDDVSASGEVKTLLDDAAAQVQSPSFVEVTVQGGSVRVRAGLSLDDHVDVCGELAAALRAADSHGGKGDILLTPLGSGGPSVRIVIAEGGSRCTKAKRADARVKRAIDELMAAAMDHAPPEVRAARAAMDRAAAVEWELATSDPTLRALRERALTALERQGEAAIREALRTAAVHVYLGKKGLSLGDLPSVWGVLEALRTPLSAGSSFPDYHYKAPLEILGRVDRDAAEPLALETLEIRAPLSLSMGAVSALTGSRNPLAIVPLVRLLERSRDPPVRPADQVAAALRDLRIEGVAAAVLPLLTPELVASVSDINHPSFRYLRRIGSVLGAHPYRPGHEALAAIYRTHPGETVRTLAKNCLLLDGEAPSDERWPIGILFIDDLLAKRRL